MTRATTPTSVTSELPSLKGFGHQDLGVQPPLVLPKQGAGPTVLTTEFSISSRIGTRPDCTPRILVNEPGLSPFWQLDSWLTVVAMTKGFATPPDPMDDLTPSRAIDLLRAWTGFPVTEIADLLGVARRSVYHWATGAAKPRHEARLLGVVRALEPLTKSTQAWELREWLSTAEARDLVQSAPVPELSSRVDEAVKGRTVGRLRPALANSAQEVLPLDAAAIDRHLQSIVKRRRPRRGLRAFEPRELTDAAQVEEE